MDEKTQEGIMNWMKCDLYANAPITGDSSDSAYTHYPNEYPDNGRYTHQNRWYKPVNDNPDTIDDIVNWQMRKRLW